MASCSVGATVEDVGFDERPTAEGVRRLLSAAIDLVPSLERAHFEEVRVGLRPKTVDELPIIGRSETMPPVFYAIGHYRNGVLLAPLTAALMADLVLEDKERAELALCQTRTARKRLRRPMRLKKHLQLARGRRAHRAQRAPAAVVGLAPSVRAGHRARIEPEAGGFHRAALHADRRPRAAGAGRPAPARVLDPAAATPARRRCATSSASVSTRRSATAVRCRCSSAAISSTRATEDGRMFNHRRARPQPLLMVGEELPLRPLAARERKRRRARHRRSCEELQGLTLPDRKDFLEVVGRTRR